AGLEQGPQLVPADQLVDFGHVSTRSSPLRSDPRLTGPAHQYSSKWMFPFTLAADTSARKPRRSRISITPGGCGYVFAPVSLSRCGTPIIFGLPHRNTCALAGSSGSP